MRTPSVVDFPLSTFPTTAQRTSGTSETLRGGSRRSRYIRGWSIRDSKRVEILPPICSTTLIAISCILSTSAWVRVTPIQPVSSIGSPDTSWDSGGSAPIRKIYSPRCRVRREAVRSCALPASSVFEESNSVYSGSMGCDSERVDRCVRTWISSSESSSVLVSSSI